MHVHGHNKYGNVKTSMQARPYMAAFNKLMPHATTYSITAYTTERMWILLLQVMKTNTRESKFISTHQNIFYLVDALIRIDASFIHITINRICYPVWGDDLDARVFQGTLKLGLEGKQKL